jgi:hypothetical protein
VTNFENVTVTDALTLPSNNAPSLTKFQIVSQIYGWMDNDWQPQYTSSRPDGVADFVGASCITTLGKTSDPVRVSKLFTILSSQDSNNNLLCVDQGFIVKKDISAGGILNSNQGAILLGHGLYSSTDPPKIALTHSDLMFMNGPTLPQGSPGKFFYLTQQFDGYSPGYYYYGSDSQWHTASGSSFPQSPTPVKWQLFVRTDYDPNLLYQWNDSTCYPPNQWISLGSMQNWIGGYDTLHIVRLDGSTPANLDLGNLTIHGTVLGDVDVSGKFTSSLIPKLNYARDLGQEGQPWDILYANYVKAQTFYCKTNPINPKAIADTTDEGYTFIACNTSSYGGGSWILSVNSAGAAPALNVYAQDQSKSLFKVDMNGSITTANIAHINTPTGNLEIGSTNSSWTHFRVNGGPAFYFDNDVCVNGKFAFYGETGGVGSEKTRLQQLSDGEVKIVNSGGYGGIFRAGQLLPAPNCQGNVGTRSSPWYDVCTYSVTPPMGNDGTIGSADLPFGAMFTYYLRYWSEQQGWDSVDDLELLRRMKEIVNEKGATIIDPDTISHLRNADGFYDLGKMNGWHLSVQKKLLERIDTLEQKLDVLIRGTGAD